MRRTKRPKREASPDQYINRELSWLAFNLRVLAEARNAANPLLERLKFLAIFESNLDEFYMVRVSGLIEQLESDYSKLTPDGLTVSEQLKKIHEVAVPMRQHATQVFQKELIPNLEAEAIRIISYTDLSPRKRREVDTYFKNEIFPVCTPLVLYPAATTPFISNRSLNLVVVLENPSAELCLARVKIPSILPRAIRTSTRNYDYVMIEDIIANNLDALFPGVEIRGAYPFRVIRDADIEIRELEAADLLTAVEEMTRRRRFGAPVRIDLNPKMPQNVRSRLLTMLELDESDVFEVSGLIGLDFLWELAALDLPKLKYSPFAAFHHESLSTSDAIFESIKKGPVIGHQPFDSFRPVEEFIASAARDPKVIGIKQSLYRVGSHSPIVESLLAAAEEGKQVAVMVELKARFDESNNIVWARALERAGAHVSYGFSELKTHCKLCLIVRREGGSMHTYAHLGTGNYNPATARLYTDLGIFTDNPDVCQDIAELFNYLTGFSKQSSYRTLLVAPINLREGIIERIEREIEHHKETKNGRIIFKLNSLVDPEVTDVLYDASRAGIKIDLIVRGICCLRPGIVGFSENITVTSIVGRFLEHSRAYYFGNNGDPELLIGSADLMRRNLDLRIEVLAPVQSVDLVRLVKQEVLDICLRDNTNAWKLQCDGTYVRRKPTKNEPAFNSHLWLLANPTSKSAFEKTRSDIPVNTQSS